MNKVSLRFYKDHKVRAIWDEELGLWWFSVLDVLGAINEQEDYEKTRNYWKYLKTKLKKEGNEVVSITNQLKLVAPDGKRRLTDVLDFEGVSMFARNIHNTKATKFLDWFTYSDNSIDGQSRKKAYTLWEGNGRSTRIWLDMILKKSLKMCIDWSQIDKKAYLAAMRRSTTDVTAIKALLRSALTDRITDRELFMKGIDYSYYYEQED